MATRVPNITGLEFNLSDRCNLACGFCYTRNGLGAGPDMARTEATLAWFFGQFEAIPEAERPKVASVSIFGGEPLVEWEDLKATIALIGKRWSAIPVKVGIVTNMTLLTEERLDWLVSNNVSISPSIDGCPEAEDCHRCYASGSGASAEVMPNAKRLLASRPNQSCRMTVSPETVGMVCKSVRYLCEELGFRQVNAILAGGVKWSDADLATHRAQITALTDWWLDEMRAGRHYSLYHLRNPLKGLARGERRTELCHAGRMRVAVDTRGDIWPCHRFCNLSSKPEYKLGTIREGITNHALRERLQGVNVARDLIGKCASCPAVLGCHAVCLHESMLMGGDLLATPPQYCPTFTHYWAEAMRANAILTAEKNDLYAKTYRRTSPTNAPTARPVPLERRLRVMRRVLGERGEEHVRRLMLGHRRRGIISADDHASLLGQLFPTEAA